MAANAKEIELLKKMVHELDVKSQEDEKRVSDMNVNIENLHMNVSFHNRTVQGQLEDRKSKLSCCDAISDNIGSVSG